MPQLTQEHFDKQLKELASKKDLAAQTTELKTFAQEQTEELARITSKGFAGLDRRIDTLEKQLDVTERVDKLEEQVKKIADALRVKL